MNSIKPLYTYLDELDFESKTAQHAKYFGLDIMVYRQFVFGFLQKLYERIADESAQPSEKPLTLDELRQMDGEPVWVQELPPYTTAGYKVLAAPAVNEYGDICFDGGDCYAPYDYGKTWLAYRTKPERSEG